VRFAHARLVVLVSAAVIALATASAAAAFVNDPVSTGTWSTAPSGGCSVVGLIGGDCALPPEDFGPDGSLNTSDALATAELETSAEVIPRLATVPALDTIILGTAAFSVGWEIGSTINHKWLHLFGVGLGNTQNVPASVTQVAWMKETRAPITCGTGCSYGNPAGRALNYWVSGTQYEFFHPGCETDLNCSSLNQALAQAAAAVSSSASLYCNGIFYIGHNTCVWLIPETSFPGALVQDKPLQPYTGQSSSISTGWANPSTGAGVTTTAPAFNSGPTNPLPCVFMSGATSCLNGGSPSGQYTLPPQPSNGDSGYSDPNANHIRHDIDPQNWADPPNLEGGPEWSGTGGPKITIPDCYGATVADCEAAIDGAIAATGATFHAAFPRMTATTYDPSLGDGLVAGTDPAAGVLADPSSVTLEINESGNDCRSRTDYPHPSVRTPASGMLVKGFVQCRTYTGPVTVTTVLYECSAEPSGDTYSVLHANGNCTEYAGQPTTISVLTTNKWYGKSLAFTGNPRDSSKWYIGVTFGSSVEPSVSQLIGPSS
jgi:hypothetical protein